MKGGIARWLRCMYKHFYGVQIHIGGRATSIAHGLFGQEARDHSGERVEDGKHYEYDFGAEVDLDGLPPYKHALAFKVSRLMNKHSSLFSHMHTHVRLTNKHWLDTMSISWLKYGQTSCWVSLTHSFRSRRLTAPSRCK